MSQVKQSMTIYNEFVIDGKIESEIAHVLVEPDSRYLKPIIKFIEKYMMGFQIL